MMGRQAEDFLAADDAAAEGTTGARAAACGCFEARLLPGAAVIDDCQLHACWAKYIPYV